MFIYIKVDTNYVIICLYIENMLMLGSNDHMISLLKKY
jgi:hypothetical protein